MHHDRSHTFCGVFAPIMDPIGRMSWAAHTLIVSLLFMMACGSTPHRTQQDHESNYGHATPVRTETGLASYYSDALAGNTTANGEHYTPSAYTAASRTLPFGTIVRVTRTDNQRHVWVRINDRGPFRDKRRILDLSRAAAEALDMIRAGVVPIRAEIMHMPGEA